MPIEAHFLAPCTLLLLRLITAIVFFSSGKSHAQKPEERGRQIGMSPGATSFLGVMEVIAAVSIGLGVFTQVGAAIIMVVMLGAIWKKINTWHTGFYAKKGFGWHYDLLLFASAAVIFTTGGGRWTLLW
jgi:putative oxidoreductase